MSIKRNWNWKDDERMKRWFASEEAELLNERVRNERVQAKAKEARQQLPTDGERAAAAEATAEANQEIVEQTTDSMKWWRGLAVIAIGAFFLSRC